jgi:hypothetical protein
MADERVLPQPIGDVGPCNVQDHEVNLRGDRIVFSDVWEEPHLNVDLYVVRVDDAGRFELNGNAVAMEVVDQDGGCIRLGLGDRWPDFPNGAEWSRVADEEAWIYYSSLGAGRVGPVQIRRKARDASGIWDAPWNVAGTDQIAVVLPFVGPTFDRYHVNCWESDVLTERILLYVRQVPGAPARPPHPTQYEPLGMRCWCVDRRGRQSVDEHEFGESGSTGAVQSSPLRPVPQLPAVLTLDLDSTSSAGDPTLVLQWRLLFHDSYNRTAPHARSTVEAEIYRYTHVETRGLSLVSVGCRRHPGEDTRAAKAWVVYAIWHGDPAETGSFARPCWIDAVLVSWAGPYGGPVPSVPPDPSHLVVVRQARIVPRLGDDAAFRWILDDENFKDPVDELPYVSVAVGRLGHENTNVPQQTVLHAVCIAPPPDTGEFHIPGYRPVMTHGGGEVRDGLRLTEPVRELQTSADDGRKRLDPEVMVSGRVPYVYYTVQDERGQARFWRAEARP